MVFHHPIEYEQVKDQIWMEHEEEIVNVFERDFVHNLWAGKTEIASWMDLVQRKVLERRRLKASTDQRVVSKARSIKTERELDRIRLSSQICQQIIREAVAWLALEIIADKNK